MKIALNIITLIALFLTFLLCLGTPLALSAHGAYEKELIKYGLMLSYPIFIFSIYWFFNVTFFSYPAKNAFFWSSVIVGAPIIFILSYAFINLAKSTYVNAILFTPVEGLLIFEGKLAAGAKITRWVRLREDEPSEDIYFANDKGEFSFPIKWQEIRISPIAPYSVLKFITVKYAGKDFHISSKDKDRFTMEIDQNVKPLRLQYELTDEHLQF